MEAKLVMAGFEVDKVRVRVDCLFFKPDCSYGELA